MTLKNLGSPSLPIAKNLIYEVLTGRTAEPAKQLRSCRRRASACIEQRYFDLSPRKRRINSRQISDYGSQKTETHSGLNNGQKARNLRRGHDIPIAQGKKSFPAVINQLVKLDWLPVQMQVVSCSKLQQGKSENKPRRPEREQDNKRQGPEVPQKVFLLAG